MRAVINEYAEALFMLAQESGLTDEFSKQLKTVKHAFRNNPDYVLLLSAPGIPKEERASLVEQSFSDCHEYVISFLRLLCENGHISGMLDCINEYEALRKSAQNTLVARVTSAVELNDKQKSAIKEKLQKRSGKKVQLKCRVDNKIIGGLVIEMDGRIMDGSIKRGLHDIREVIK